MIGGRDPGAVERAIVEQVYGRVPERRAEAPTAAQRRQAAVRALLACYPGGEAAQAVLDVAREAGVAVHYLDRAAIQLQLAVEFTDEEWAAVQAELDGFDEAVGQAYGVSERIGDFLDQAVHDAGLDLLGLQARHVERLERDFAEQARRRGL